MLIEAAFASQTTVPLHRVANVENSSNDSFRVPRMMAFIAGRTGFVVYGDASVPAPPRSRTCASVDIRYKLNIIGGSLSSASSVNYCSCPHHGLVAPTDVVTTLLSHTYLVGFLSFGQQPHHFV
jgi:hypothetical protein